MTDRKPDDPDVRSKPVNTLAQLCAAEMARSRQHTLYDTGCCYELFRRALLERDQEAWAAVYGQYQHLVRRWVGTSDLDGDVLVNDAFRRFWQAMSPQCFAGCPTAAALLAYLKRCARSARFDALRQVARRQVTQEARERWRELGGAAAPHPTVEDPAEAVSHRQLYDYVFEQLESAEERLVFEASFVWHLKPREIAAEWPHLLDTAQQVSRVKERVVRRLTRDATLKSMLGLQDGGNR